MSEGWQKYIDRLLKDKFLESAAIVGMNGKTWATGTNIEYGKFEVSSEEAKTIIKGIKNPDLIQKCGFRVNGKSQLTLAMNKDKNVNAKDLKEGKCGVACELTKLCLIVGRYGRYMQPGNAALRVGEVADFLRKNGY